MEPWKASDAASLLAKICEIENRDATPFLPQMDTTHETGGSILFRKDSSSTVNEETQFLAEISVSFWILLPTIRLTSHLGCRNAGEGAGASVLTTHKLDQPSAE
jgi:hypothetical protein